MSDEEPSERGETGDDALLHRYVDGDLSAAERTALAARVARDPSVAKRIEGLLEVGALTEKAALQSHGDALDADAMFAKIEAKIAMEESSDGVSVEPRARPELRVLQGGASKTERQSDGAAGDGAAGEGVRRKDVPAMPADVRRRRVVGVVIGALAVAAAAAIALTQGTNEAPEVAVEDPPVAPGEITPGAEGPELEGPELAGADPARTEVLEVDFGTNVGSIFSVEGDDGERYVVIWVDESDTVSN